MLHKSNKQPFNKPKNGEKIYIRSELSVPVGKVLQDSYETGIDKTSPAIMIIDSIKVFVDSFHLKTGLVIPFVSSGDEGIKEAEVGTYDNFDIDYEQLNFAYGYLDAKADSPRNIHIFKNKPIFEEQIFIGCAFGSTVAMNVGGNPAGVIMEIEMTKYSVTEKKWYDMAVSQTTESRFI